MKISFIHATDGIRNLLFLSVLFSILVSQVIKAYDCSIHPFTLNIINTSFPDENQNVVAVNRGPQFSIAGQVLGLRPTFNWNGSRIRLASDCADRDVSVERACQGASGSVFNSSGGNWTPINRADWGVNDAPPPGSTGVLYGRADADFGHGVKINMPFELYSKNFSGANPYKSFLALGPSSPVLQALLDGGFIASKVIGIFYGSRSVSQPTDGEIIFGGWNPARVIGPWYNFTINDPHLPMSITCPLRVAVTGVTLTSGNGVSTPILPPGQNMTACVDLYQNAFQFPDSMNATWIKATNWTGFDPATNTTYDSQTFDASKEGLLGNLSIQIDNRFSVTVPHYELVVPNRGSNTTQSGAYEVLNDGKIQASVALGQSDYGINFGMLLGGVFASGVYLLVDYERGILSMAQANIGPEIADPQVVCSLNTTVPLGPAPPSNSTSSGSGGGMDLSTKLGIAIGIPSLFVAILATIFTYWSVHESRMHRRESQAAATALSREGSRMEQAPRNSVFGQLSMFSGFRKTSRQSAQSLSRTSREPSGDNTSRNDDNKEPVIALDNLDSRSDNANGDVSRRNGEMA